MTGKIYNCRGERIISATVKGYYGKDKFDFIDDFAGEDRFDCRDFIEKHIKNCMWFSVKFKTEEPDAETN